jgi:hypothetical protein
MQLKTSVLRSRSAALIVREGVPVNSPYDIISIGAKATHALVAAGAPIVAAYWPSVTVADLEKAEAYKFVIAAPGVVGGLSQNGQGPFFDSKRIDMNNFDELYNSEEPWDGSADHAVRLIARLLRYESCLEDLSAAPKFHLLVQLWKPTSARRWRELCTALQRNAENPFVHRIHVMQEADAVAEAWAKWPANLKEKLVVLEPASARLTYRAALDYLAKLPASDYAAFANADIYFDQTLRELWTTDFKGTCLALLRYEAKAGLDDSEAKLFGPRDDSQDAWIFRVADLKAQGADSWRPLTFALGQAGCDNAFAGELVRRRWRVANPCMSIRTLHLHESAVRSYREDDRVTMGVYATVAPSGVLESRLLDAGRFGVAGQLEVSVPAKFVVDGRNAAGMNLLYKTVMPDRVAQVAQQMAEPIKVKVLAAPPGAIVTSDGLVTFDGGIGFSEDRDASELAWAQTNYNSLTPLKVVERGIFVPCVSRHAADEMLRLGRALALLDATGLQSAVMPSAWARLFDGLTGPLRLENIGERALLCQQGAIGQLPSIQRQSAYSAGPAVAALRQHLLPAIGHNVSSGSGWVLFGADDEMVDALSAALNHDIVVSNYVNPNAAPGRLLPTIRVASVIVGNEWSLGYMWAATPGVTYIDMAPSAAAAALATICGLRYVPMGGDISVADLIAASATD